MQGAVETITRPQARFREFVNKIRGPNPCAGEKTATGDCLERKSRSQVGWDAEMFGVYAWLGLDTLDLTRATGQRLSVVQGAVMVMQRCMFSGTHSGPGALNEQGRRKQAPGGPLGPPPPRAKAQSRDFAFGRGEGTRALYDVIEAHAACES